MQIILLEKVENLGNIGDIVKVRSGYGRNFLLPKGKAKMATKENVAEFEKVREELERQAAQELTTAQQRAESIDGATVEIKAKAGSEGKLFGSVGTVDIAEACEAKGIAIERREVRLLDGPLRIVGEHDVEIHLHTDVNAMIKVNIVADEE